MSWWKKALLKTLKERRGDVPSQEEILRNYEFNRNLYFENGRVIKWLVVATSLSVFAALIASTQSTWLSDMNVLKSTQFIISIFLAGISSLSSVWMLMPSLKELWLTRELQNRLGLIYSLPMDKQQKEWDALKNFRDSKFDIDWPRLWQKIWSALFLSVLSMFWSILIFVVTLLFHISHSTDMKSEKTLGVPDIIIVKM